MSREVLQRTAKRSSRHDLPTPESPMSKSCIEHTHRVSEDIAEGSSRNAARPRSVERHLEEVVTAQQTHPSADAQRTRSQPHGSAHRLSLRHTVLGPQQIGAAHARARREG